MSRTIAQTNLRIDALASDVAEIKALLLARVGEATPAKVTQARAPKVAPVQVSSEFCAICDTKWGCEHKGAPAPARDAQGKVRRCKAQTKAGTRCKVVSRGKFCGLHRVAETDSAEQATPKRASSAKKATPAKATKGAQAAKGAEGGSLTRSEWNKTLTTKARLAGGGLYKAVVGNWTQVQEMRTNGATPDAVLAAFQGRLTDR